MQNFVQNRWKFSGIFLFISLHSVVVAMNTKQSSPVVLNNSAIRLEQIMTIFDPKKELERGTQWNKVVPGSIMITPDGKGVVIGDSGRVRYCRFDREKDDEFETIIEHRSVAHTPIIDIARKKDGSLLIVSAGNYIDSEQKRVSEYVLYCDGTSKIQKLDWSIQAISLDCCGKTLAIAGRRDLFVIDFETGKSSRSVFKGVPNHHENWIVDIAIMNPVGKAVIAVGSQAGVQWINNQDSGLTNLKQVVSKDIIKKIYYPSAEDLLYLTGNGEAKRIKLESLLESNGDDMEKTTLFAHPWPYDMVVADPSGHVATAHWTNKKDNVEGAHRKIKVYCGDKDFAIEEFVLEIPTLDERYDYITEFGQCASGVGHLLHIALRGKQVVALATDGKMRVWSLPVKHASYDNTREEFYRKLKERKCDTQVKPLSTPISTKGRARSSSDTEKLNKKGLTVSADSVHLMDRRKSAPRKPSLTVSADSVDVGDNKPKNDAIDNKQKKSSPRFIQILKTSSAHNSRENSLSPSRESSPSHSPHRPEKNEVSFADVTEIKTTKTYEDKI